MRYGQQHNEAIRQQIVEAASRLFREHGIAAVGLARVMGEVGLTVGTFYTHFASKEALVRDVLQWSLDERHAVLVHALRHGDLERLARAYLSPAHRDSPGAGCPVAALAAEVARHPVATRGTFAAHNAPTLDALASRLSTVRGEPASRADAAAVLGLLVGTLQLARATVDRDVSDAILEAGVRAVTRLAP